MGNCGSTKTKKKIPENPFDEKAIHIEELLKQAHDLKNSKLNKAKSKLGEAEIKSHNEKLNEKVKEKISDLNAQIAQLEAQHEKEKATISPEQMNKQEERIKGIKNNFQLLRL